MNFTRIFKISTSVWVSIGAFFFLILALTFGLFFTHYWVQLGTYACFLCAVIGTLSIVPYLFSKVDETKIGLMPFTPAERLFGYLFETVAITLSGPLVLFCLIVQSQINPKMPPLTFISIHNIVQTQRLSLFLPWVVISAISIGCLIYGALQQKAAWIPGISVDNAEEYPRKFFHAAMMHVLNISIISVALILLICALEMINHGIASGLGVHSVWQAPVRNILLLIGIVIFTKNKRDRFLKKYTQRGFSLGGIFLIYLVTISFALLGFEGFVRFSGVPVEESQLLQITSLQNILNNHTFIQGLLTFWPLLFIPYLIPTIARLSIGLPIWKAFLYPLIFPGLVYFIILPHCLNIVSFLNFTHQLQSPNYFILLGLILAIILYCLFQHVYKHHDLHLGKMPKTGVLYRNYGLFLLAFPIIRALFFYWMPFLFIYGWLAIQTFLFGLELLLFLILIATSLVMFYKSVRFIHHWSELRVKSGISQS